MGETVFIPRTGEIIENVVVIKTEESEEKKKRYKKNMEKRKDLYEVINNNCGNFYFYKYDKVLDVLQDDTATGFRFLYLCACAEPDGRIIAYKNKYCKTIGDFTYVFEKTIDTVKKYLDKILKNNLISKTDGEYIINSEYFATNLSDKEFRGNSVRIFNDAIKELYRNSDYKEHSLLGQLVKLIPYTNVHSNIICWNIQDKDVTKIQPFTHQEIQHILQPKNNYGYELLNKLETILIKDELVIGRFEAGKEEHYKINPRLFYRGNDPKALTSLIQSFDLSTHQYKERVKRKKMTKGV